MNVKTGKNPSALNDKEISGEAVIRLVTNDSGCLVYASKALAAALQIDSEALVGRPLGDVLAFSEPDDVFRTKGLFGPQGGDAWIDGFYEGLHDVFLCGSDKKLAALQFDCVRARDGRRFLIGAAQEAGGPRDQDILSTTGPFAERLRALMGEEKTTALALHSVSSGTSGAANADDLRHFLDMSNDVMAISLRDGTFSRVNSTFTQVLGYRDEDLRRRTFLDLVHPDDRAHVRGCVYGMMHDDAGDGQIIDFEARVLSRNGAEHWIEWRQKRTGGAIYSVGRDVTAIKQHEAMLRKKQQMLSEAQAIGHMGHWHWAVGEEDIEWSDEIYNIFGVVRGDFRPNLESLGALVHRRDISRLMQAFQRAIIEKNNYEMEFRILRPGGETRYLRCEGKCEFDESGDVAALFGVMQDITERTLHERDLREAKDSAERAYAAKSQFLANMSHELRTPLNAIIGFSEMMQRQLLGPLGTPRYLDYITGILESGEHLLDLISDILDMSKIEAGKYELDLEEFHVAKVVRLAAHMMEGRAQDARIRLSVDVEDENFQIVADRRALMQILLNLLSNSVKFTQSGGAVRVECLGLADHLIIKVYDTGIGIPANKLASVTNPFEQAAGHETREHEGTGLGLAITKELTEMHGGVLHIESAAGVGTTVTINLPRDARGKESRPATSENS